MMDLDLYSELLEEDVELENGIEIPDDLRPYFQALQSKCARLETEFEALSDRANRLEIEKSQAIELRDRVMNNFALLALACRREIGKMKQRMQYLCQKARLNEPKYPVCTITEQVSSLNPEASLSYGEVLTYLHSHQSPHKSVPTSQSTHLNEAPARGSDLANRSHNLEVVPSERRTPISSQQPQEKYVVSRVPTRSSRNPSSVSSSSSSSSGSESSGSSSSSSSESSGARSRSASVNTNRSSFTHSHPRTAELSLKSNRQSTQVRSTSDRSNPHKTDKITNPAFNLPRPCQNRSRTGRSSPSASQATDRRQLKPYDRCTPRRLRSKSPFGSSQPYRRVNEDRGFNRHLSTSSRLVRLNSPHRVKAHESRRSTAKHVHSTSLNSTSRDRKRTSDRPDVTHRTSASSTDRHETFSLPTKRAKCPRTPSEERSSTEHHNMESRDRVHLKGLSIEEKGSEHVGVKSHDQNVSFNSVEAQMLRHLVGLVEGSVRQARDHHTARRMMQPSPKALDQLIIVEPNQSTDDPSGASEDKYTARDTRVSNSHPGSPKSEQCTLYTKRLQNRLFEVRTETTTTEADISHPVPPIVDTIKDHQTVAQPMNSLPASSRSPHAAEEVTESRSTLPNPDSRLALPLTQPCASPVPSDPAPIISVTPILDHSYADESFTEQAGIVTEVTAKSSQPAISDPEDCGIRSAVNNSTGNWSSFDEEVLFEADLPPANSPHSSVPDEYDSIVEEEMSGIEGIKEEGEIADELEDEEEEPENKPSSEVRNSLPDDRRQRNRTNQENPRSWFPSYDHAKSQSVLRSPHSRTRESSSGSTPERFSHTRRPLPVQPHPKNRISTPGSWRKSNMAQKVAGHRRSRSRSFSPESRHQKLTHSGYKSPVGSRSPDRSFRSHARTRNYSPNTRLSSIRDRNRSPSHRDRSSTASRHSSDPIRDSGGTHRTERYGYHARPHSPRNNSRFDQDWHRTARNRRQMPPQVHIRAPLNSRRFPPRSATGSRRASKRF